MTATKQATEFKVGDWCFSDFELCVIQEIDPEHGISSTSTGYVERGGWDQFCVPLSKEAVRWSGEVRWWVNDLRRKSSPMNLNWPDIHRKFVDIWERGCEYFHDEEKMREAYDELQAFGRELEKAIVDARSGSVAGIRLMR